MLHATPIEKKTRGRKKGFKVQKNAPAVPSAMVDPAEQSSSVCAKPERPGFAVDERNPVLVVLAEEWERLEAGIMEMRGKYAQLEEGIRELRGKQAYLKVLVDAAALRCQPSLNEKGI